MEKNYEILPEDYPNYDLSFKVIVIGNSGVGKSCLSVKATKNIFTESYSATIGFEFFTFNIKLNNNKVIKLQIWDTCGQEIYRSLITNFYRNCSLAIIVYSVTEYIYYIMLFIIVVKALNQLKHGSKNSEQKRILMRK
jgi:small GTP-binding protein